MANGPPTPPPTTAAEMLDDVRTSALESTDTAATPPSGSGPTPADTTAPTSIPSAPAPATPATPQQFTTIYHRVFPTLARFAEEGNIKGLIFCAEEADQNGEHERQLPRLLLTAPLVLAYLIEDTPSYARYALTRLSDFLTSNPLPQALMQLVAATWERKHERVYQRAATLCALTARPDFLDPQLGALIVGMTELFVVSFRRRTFATLSKAYTSLPISLAGTYLGLTPDETVAEFTKGNWAYDSSAQVLTPPADALTATRFDGRVSGSSSLATFHAVADGVAKLEV
ncbi:hypothetical protein PLICRDRAFT_41266 [Plicaturopsis crispa FD-325 SS-3]|nr:hypothetical protein PLICRDRAFT_41266 [Plicaturopsis crispa FD-325 SS-3]